MFDIITKEDCWGWFDAGVPSTAIRQAAVLSPLGQRGDAVLRRLQRVPGLWRLRSAWRQANAVSVRRERYALKTVQDAFLLSRLRQERGKTILEAGGGHSRLLPHLKDHNECWLADRFEREGNGPLVLPDLPGVRIVRAYLGDASPELPAAHFDYVVSVSVMEHVPLEGLEACFADAARLLKPGGRLLHAIDTYLFDPRDAEAAAGWKERTRAYLAFANRPDLGLTLAQPPAIDEHTGFSCRYATLPDNQLHEWQRNKPSPKRLIAQVVSIKAEWIKGGLETI